MRSVRGGLTEEGVPWVPVEIGDRTVEAVIDTGFNGELALPADLVNQLGLTPIAFVFVELADGSWHVMPVSTGRISIGGMELPVEIVIGAAEPSIGTGLLRHFRLILDIREGLVELEPHEASS